MKILIVSDTHRSNTNFLEVMDKTAPLDMVVRRRRGQRTVNC